MSHTDLEPIDVSKNSELKLVYSLLRVLTKGTYGSLADSYRDMNEYAF